MDNQRKWRAWKSRLGTLLLGLLFTAACTVQPVVIQQEGTTSTDEIQEQAEAQGLTVEQATILAQLDSRSPAPELTNETWLNTENGEALRLADLRGNVVIVEFWTYG